MPNDDGVPMPAVESQRSQHGHERGRQRETAREHHALALDAAAPCAPRFDSLPIYSTPPPAQLLFRCHANAALVSAGKRRVDVGRADAHALAAAVAFRIVHLRPTVSSNVSAP